MLLQIFDDGHLSDAKGRKVDFRNTIIIMTSNVGSDLIRKDSRLGFSVSTDEIKNADDQYRRMKDQVTEAMKRVFRPEFLNRIDQSVVFHALTADNIRKIVNLELGDMRNNLRQKEHGGGRQRRPPRPPGDRGLRPGVRGSAVAPRHPERDGGHALRPLLDGTFSEGDTVRLDYEDGKVVATKVVHAPAPPPEPVLT